MMAYLKFHHPTILQRFYKDYKFHGLQNPHGEAFAATHRHNLICYYTNYDSFEIKLIV